MRINFRWRLVGVSLLAAACYARGAETLNWSEEHDVERGNSGWVATGVDPFLVTELPARAPATAHCLLLDLRVSQPVDLQILWTDGATPWQGDQLLTTRVDAMPEPATIAIDLHRQNTFRGATRVRIDPGNVVGVEFDIRRVALVEPVDVPDELLAGLIDLCCYASKLHYAPGETIQFRAALNAYCYPDQGSAKLLELRFVNAAGETVVKHHAQYAFRPGCRYKEVQGVLPLDEPLPPGRYDLHAQSRDLRSGRVLTARHRFGVQDANDPFVYETPFKFVKDFSIIRGPDGRWHVFSITGDFFDGHDWQAQGQERTFSHGSSADFRDWTMHPPVISINNAEYPDGRGRYQDRNVWAPHVIEHAGRYWMFYTSVNQHVSQSISLATSPDLFDWTEHPRNPVFTLEGVEWADWARDRWADCRDPCVLKVGDRFYMYVTASAKPPGARGAVVVAESDDLIHWRNRTIAVRRSIASESPQVWRVGDQYCMTTSSHGGTTYVSDHPAHGWVERVFPRPPVLEVEKYVETSPSYAEEVCRLADETYLIAGLTWRLWGNSIYIFRMHVQDGAPARYESPWRPTTE